MLVVIVYRNVGFLNGRLVAFWALTRYPIEKGIYLAGADRLLQEGNPTHTSQFCITEGFRTGLLELSKMHCPLALNVFSFASNWSSEA